MTHGSLFSGIGGFDLAAEWAGFSNRWQVEKDPFCQRVLRKHFPTATLYPDITTLDLHALEHVDLVSGGFPCQPFSTAGQRRGTSDDRYLWDAMLAVIEVIGPTWVIAENVAGLISMGLDHVCASLEAAGYTVWALVIPACATGAPHRRDRVWIVATLENAHEEPVRGRSTSWGQQQLGHTRAADAGRPDTHAEGSECELPCSARAGRNGPSDLHSATPHPSRERLQGRELTGAPSESTRPPRSAAECDSHAAHPHGERQQQPGGAEREIGRRAGHHDQDAAHAGGTNGGGRPEGTGRRLGSAQDARAGWLEPWPEVAARLCRVDDGLPRRMDRGRRLKALGNAIVPQVAYQIFTAIKSAA